MKVRGLSSGMWPKPKGAGDVIANITRITGTDKVAKFVAKSVGKEDCGCDARRESLNKILPFNKK